MTPLDTPPTDETSTDTASTKDTTHTNNSKTQPDKPIAKTFSEKEQTIIQHHMYSPSEEMTVDDVLTCNQNLFILPSMINIAPHRPHKFRHLCQ